MKSPFLTWCAAQGITSPLQLCGEQSSYRYTTYLPDTSLNDLYDPTVFSTDNDDATTNTVPILKVPLKSCIIASTPQKLSLKLAAERDLGDRSDYAPYIAALPQLLDLETETESIEKGGIPIMNDMPRFWTPSKISSVTPYDGGQLESQLLRIESELDVSLREDGIFSERLDPWAYACVTSRANYLPGYGFAMTPVLDMANHRSTAETTARIVFDDDDDGGGASLILSIESEEGFETGKEVFISYGELTNLETLCNYGFVSEENNPYNEERIMLRLIQRPMEPVKLVIHNSDGGGDGKSGSSSFSSVIDLASLATLRSCLVDPTEVKRKIEEMNHEVEEKGGTTVYDESSLGVYYGPFSDDSEEEVYSFMASYIDEALDDARMGVEDAREKGDGLLERYLSGRVGTLEKGMAFIKKKYPVLEY